jgi:hypothetical protein
VLNSVSRNVFLTVKIVGSVFLDKFLCKGFIGKQTEVRGCVLRDRTVLLFCLIWYDSVMSGYFFLVNSVSVAVVILRLCVCVSFLLIMGLCLVAEKV